jgi:hypothetical protein
VPEGTGKARAAVRDVLPPAAAGARAAVTEAGVKEAPGGVAGSRPEAERGSGRRQLFITFASVGASLPYIPWRTMIQACLQSPFDEDLTWLK